MKLAQRGSPSRVTGCEIAVGRTLVLAGTHLLEVTPEVGGLLILDPPAVRVQSKWTSGLPRQWSLSTAVRHVSYRSYRISIPVLQGPMTGTFVHMPHKGTAYLSIGRSLIRIYCCLGNTIREKGLYA